MIALMVSLFKELANRLDLFMAIRQTDFLLAMMKLKHMPFRMHVQKQAILNTEI
ncbi:hypothetical protein D3C73_966980 [compost metagenome]